jgi:predicted outer membrane repeat protein
VRYTRGGDAKMMRTSTVWAALWLVACGPGGAGGALTVEPEQLDFGIVGIGSDATLDITLSNGGDTEVTLLSATLITGNPELFAIDRGGVDSIGPGSEATVAVTFSPIVEQPATGVVQLRTDFDGDTSFEVGLVGEGGPSVEDADGDGYSAAQGDCDDDDPYQSPGADEICDGQDTDCDGMLPAEEADADGDGSLICQGDCDDTNPARTPGRVEICDGLDNDCDDFVPDNLDQDFDGYTLCDGDCDDAQPLTSPGEPEVCDGLDNDCDTDIDNVDVDNDGHSVCSLAGDCNDNNPNAYPVVVSPSGSALGDGTDADPYDSIELALENLDTVCRTVVLTRGTHTGVYAEWTSGEVAIVGETGVAGDVVLEAPAKSRLFLVASADLTLADLTVSGGDAAEDGGAILVQGATVALDNVALLENTSANDGGAIAAVSSTVTVSGGCVFDSNVAADDGGAVLLDASTLIDDGTQYIDNFGVRGGAIYGVGGTLALDDTLLRENVAVEGGAIAITGSGSYTIERSRFVLNESTADGGAIALRDALNSGTLRNNRFQDNNALGGGGAIAVLGDSASGDIVNNTFHGNVATDGGAGLFVDVSSGGGLSVRSNVLQSNDGPSALYATGGALVTHNTGYLTNSGVHFAGSIVDGDGAPLDSSNVVRNPALTSASDDGNPDNDTLTLTAGSPEINSGVPLTSFNDADGSTNDRGYTGGPAAE